MVTPVLRCQACRHSLLDAFTALAGISVPARRLPLHTPKRSSPPTRTLHSTVRNLQQDSTTTSSSKDAPSDPTPPPSDDLSKTDATTTSSLPWYLQTTLPPAPTAPLHSTSLLARQSLPPLPTNPPPLLSPLLTHISTSLGLTSLSLLDLRTLQPPPALGANLLMIIGTARSVKHLNVSADRLCRWLRSTYGLRPYADGLLGRNELKIKLRRRARRQKLMRAAGRVDEEVGKGDDGITTGWVCVVVGDVEGVMPKEGKVVKGDGVGLPAREREVDDDELVEGEEEYENPSITSSSATEGEQEDVLETEAAEEEDAEDTDPSYIGFGSRTGGQRIVVQMFTEDKRAEMNLEELWDVRSARRARKEEKMDAEAVRREEKEIEGRQRARERAEAAKAAAAAAAEAQAKAEEEVEGGRQEEEVVVKPPKKRKVDDSQWSPLFRDIK